MVDTLTVQNSRRRWWNAGAFPVLLLFATLLASLYLLSDATQNSDAIGPYYGWLLLGNAVGLIVLAGVLAYQVFRLLIEYWQKRAGIRLTLRMILVFVVLATVPVSLVYLLSVQFLQRGIDSWFDVRIETALNDSLELSRDAMADRIRDKARDTLKMAKVLANRPNSIVTLDIVDLRLTSGADELAVIDTSGRVIAFTNVDTEVLVPNTPSELVYSQLRQGYPYLDMEPIDDRGFYIRVVMAIPDTAENQSGERRLLQVLYPVPDRLNTMAQNVQSAFAAYRELSFIRDDLKKSFVLTLSLALVLNVLAALILAIMSARYLVAPVGILVDGTRAVAKGEYHKRLPVTSTDELGLLVGSFNDMIQQVEEASEEAQANRQLAEEERAYVQTVLSRLSSGVVTLDNLGRIVTMNPMAKTILQLKQVVGIYMTLDELAEACPHLATLTESIGRHLESGKQEWQQEVTLMGRQGRQVLRVTGGMLVLEKGHEGEHVVMFDDVTDFVQAQRNAAWGEMARRLAHEIKNPLTPIQLSAERVRHKCLDRIEGKPAEVLDKATQTIINQVESMKDMVNAFTQYARTPELKLEPLSINQLVSEVADMYRDESSRSPIRLALTEQGDRVEADAGRIRQLLHNLIRNAIDAISEQDDGELLIETQVTDQGVRLVVSDNGSGFDEVVLGAAFEPYVTTKQHGTGLGLAIVRKIVEEHSGVIKLANRESSGAEIEIVFPLMPNTGNTELKESHA